MYKYHLCPIHLQEGGCSNDYLSVRSTNITTKISDFFNPPGGVRCGVYFYFHNHDHTANSTGSDKKSGQTTEYLVACDDCSWEQGHSSDGYRAINIHCQSLHQPAPLYVTWRKRYRSTWLCCRK